MAYQFSVSGRNAMLDALVAAAGASPTLEVRSGAVPATCATADSGSVLATLALPATWMNSASGGQATKAGTWQDTSADATGSAGHFRIKSSGGTVHFQGSVSATGGGGDLVLARATVDLVAGDNLSITGFTLTAGGA